MPCKALHFCELEIWILIILTMMRKKRIITITIKSARETSSLTAQQPIVRKGAKACMMGDIKCVILPS